MKKEQYLNKCKSDRLCLETSLLHVYDWLREVEDIVNSAVDGLDYNTIDHSFSEFDVCFMLLFVFNSILILMNLFCILCGYFVIV